MQIRRARKTTCRRLTAGNYTFSVRAIPSRNWKSARPSTCRSSTRLRPRGRRGARALKVSTPTRSRSAERRARGAAGDGERAAGHESIRVADKGKPPAGENLELAGSATRRRGSIIELTTRRPRSRAPRRTRAGARQLPHRRRDLERATAVAWMITIHEHTSPRPIDPHGAPPRRRRRRRPTAASPRDLDRRRRRDPDRRVSL